jgi:hypothetical protein
LGGLHGDAEVNQRLPRKFQKVDFVGQMDVPSPFFNVLQGDSGVVTILALRQKKATAGGEVKSVEFRSAKIYHQWAEPNF